jgi:chloride channel 7
MAVAAESAHKKNEHIHQLSPQEERIMNAFEALDYDLCENKLFEREQLQMTAEDKRSEELIGWLIFFLIGAGTGTCAAIIDAGVEYLLEIRWGRSGRLLTGGTQSTTDDDSPVSAFFMDVLLCMAFVGISSGLVVWVEPAAAGSGIPDMKGYLNGTNLRATLTMRALLAKGVGVVFAVGGGLCVGKEGPLVHAGSVLAANVSHGFDSCVAKFKTWKKFRTDAHKVRFLRATPMHDHAVLCMGALTGGGRFCSGTSCRGAARRASPPPSARRWAGCSSRSRRPRRSGRCRLHGRASSAR